MKIIANALCQSASSWIPGCSKLRGPKSFLRPLTRILSSIKRSNGDMRTWSNRHRGAAECQTQHGQTNARDPTNVFLTQHYFSTVLCAHPSFLHRRSRGYHYLLILLRDTGIHNWKNSNARHFLRSLRQIFKWFEKLFRVSGYEIILFVDHFQKFNAIYW